MRNTRILSSDVGNAWGGRLAGAIAAQPAFAAAGGVYQGVVAALGADVVSGSLLARIAIILHALPAAIRTRRLSLSGVRARYFRARRVRPGPVRRLSAAGVCTPAVKRAPVARIGGEQCWLTRGGGGG